MFSSLAEPVGKAVHFSHSVVQRKAQRAAIVIVERIMTKSRYIT